MNNYKQNQELSKGVSYDIDNMYVLNAVEQVGGQVEANQHVIWENIEQVKRKIDNAMRRKRRAIVSRQMITANDGRIGITVKFDNGEEILCVLIHNFRGPTTVYRLRFGEISGADDWFGIYFASSGDWVIGEAARVNGSYLYRCFLEAGVQFSAEMKKTTIQQVLMEAFCSAIAQTENEFAFPARSGWHNGDFFSREMLPVLLTRKLNHFPIVNKSFVRAKATESAWKEYFWDMQGITKWSDRLIIMVFPFLGIISSMLPQHRREEMFFVNFILQSTFRKRRICKWLQVFNRHNMLPLNMDFSQKKFIQVLKDVRDEVLIADFCSFVEDSSYAKRKMSDRLSYLGKIATGEISIPGMAENEFQAVFAAISNKVIVAYGAYNIFVGEDFFAERVGREMNEDVMGMIFTEFIDFVKNHQDAVHRSIWKQRTHQNRHAATLAMIFDILQEFWRKQGIDFVESANLPAEINFDKLFEENICEKGELLPFFVTVVRKAAPNYVFMHKDQRGGSRDVIRYTEETLWFPPFIMKEILEGSGANVYESQILAELREIGYLKTDAQGLTRKLQCNQERREYYQIDRKFFTKAGQIDLVDLGKEVESDE